MDSEARTREALAALSRGGSRQWPIVVTSAAVVEVRAKAMACPHCGGEYRLAEHTSAGPGLRRVDAHCRQCSRPRTLWFRLLDLDVQTN
jgi:hypothetical protein